MPAIIDYAKVLKEMQSNGFVSLYHNSGAFGFPENVRIHTLGFITMDDPTIRPAAREFVRIVNDPAEHFPDIDADAWLMPKSHWHYELHFGNREMLEALLRTIGIDPAKMR